jgi:AcrR family transcriptional regulator
MDTKQRILDAAERLFAEHGFDGASLRAITAGAGVNLAAVNYHFRSKETLIQAVLACKLGPLNQQRLALLGEYEAEAAPRPVQLEKIARAMIGPMVRSAATSGAGSMNFGAVMGRVYLERNTRLQRLLVAELRGVIKRFLAALHRTLPGLPLEELYWRLFFSMGTVSHTLGAPGMLIQISGGVCNPSDNDQTLSRLVTYVVAGFKAPLPAHRTGKTRSGKHQGSREPAALKRPGREGDPPASSW